MKTTIDEAGRIVVPKQLRERAGIRGAQAVEITERDGRIEIAPASTAMRLVKRRSKPVALPDEKLPPLTGEAVRDVIERVRR